MTMNTTTPMTDIEALVFNYLVKRKINFQFATSLMGGFYELGGSVIDFLLPERRLAWRVFGEYWHKGVAKTGSDIIQKENLSAMGLTVVDIWSDDILNRLEQTMELALLGQEMLK